ncbi:hypothetical protein C1645_841129 [Glomus cerebriforme]|uniref:Uncharacterized protein n=1 Tax=Glomus cerebriforme TaxID=658196 RepID=A0A397S4I7_9GLOM|nr:hypothetical protein C1645_841129 [Glomus cerebriforme]
MKEFKENNKIEINEEYVGRKRSNKENIIEKEFNVNESENIVIYEGLKDDEDIIERMEIAYKLNKKEKMFKQKHALQKIENPEFV